MLSTRALNLILAAIAAVALLVPALVVRYAPAPRARPYLAELTRPKRIVTAAELPPVEPVEFQALDPEDARQYNASIAFSTAPNPAAAPFRFAGSDEQRARATDCLAAAAYYEAGDDPVGQRAVVQVVLNRLRHPAFPKTVCGVVFQGQERRTGCQFTFTCDGALVRVPSAVAWERARGVAAAALGGGVFAPVGYATHYHTDWVVPYWSASLDKIAEVHTHLFFRWTGWWGTPPAFRRAVSSDEPPVAKLAALSGAHRLAGAVDEAMAAITAAAPFVDAMPPVADGAPAAVPLAGPSRPRPLLDDADTFIVLLDPKAPESYPELAGRACGDRARCKLLGWIDARLLPASMTMSPQQYQAMGFSYLRDRAGGFDKALWNCTQFPHATPAQCMRGRSTLSAAPVPAASPTARGPVVLDGVRRLAGPAPVSSPTAAPAKE